MDNPTFDMEVAQETISLNSNQEQAEKNGEDREEEADKGKESGEKSERKDRFAAVLSREEADKKLMESVAHSEEEAYRLYCDYGHRMGFSVRKGKQYYYIGTKKIRTKDYYCSKEGHRDDEQLTKANYNRPDTRTDCKAMIRFQVDDQGQWKVIRLVSDHNHELAKPEERHLLRSARSLTPAKGGVTDPLAIVGTQHLNALADINEEGEGVDNAEFTMRDCYNNLNVHSINLIEAGDAQSLVNLFKRRTNEDGMFYWDVQVDQEGRMTNFFWRDGRSRIDYDCFGDAVVFDTTYRSNKYDLICAPFIGVNHHWQNVMFGCAFLLDETTTSFVWLFKTFLESMGGRPPKSIITSGDQEMAKAIEEVFPGTHHFLCHWQIQKDAPSHMGTLNACRPFHNMFAKCMQGCDSEMEFEDTWGAMLHEYNLHDNLWLNNLYRFKERWCTALNKDFFDAGIRSSNRSESTNDVFNEIADKSTTPARFVLAFEKLVKDWRKNELEEDFRCTQTVPARTVKHSEMLKHAANIYTRKFYRLFESDFLDGCGATSFQEIPLGGTLYRFELIMQGRGSRVYIVLLDTSTLEVTCSCKKFETMGLLCSHALKAFSVKNVDRIPERYILKRWTKDVRRGVYRFKQDESLPLEYTESERTFRNRAMRFAYNLVMKSQGHEESRKIFWDILESGEKALEKFLDSKSLHSRTKDKGASDDEDDSSDGREETHPMFYTPPVTLLGVPTTKVKGRYKKRKKKSSKGEPSSRKAKQAAGSSNFVVLPGGTQLYSVQDTRNYQQVVRPNAPNVPPQVYYPGYPSAGMPPGQVYVRPNVHPMPHFTSQESSVHGGKVPIPPNYRTVKNT
ncbi:protein FAR1-RELATED SEQUENCE 5-like isoform X2 [Ananas comosus]|nr:protein FAR1-RELATED SEQUENCE 5-like isoform X2 [Ananas comosus]